MWKEPLAASVVDIDAYNVRVEVRDAAGAVVATAPCAYNAGAGYGVFGEIDIVLAGGGPLQVRRAMALLVRHALEHARGLGLHRVSSSQARPQLHAFMLAVTGRVPRVRGSLGHAVIDTDLDSVLAFVRAHVAGDGAIS